LNFEGDPSHRGGGGKYRGCRTSSISGNKETPDYRFSRKSTDAMRKIASKIVEHMGEVIPGARTFLDMRFFFLVVVKSFTTFRYYFLPDALHDIILVYRL